MPQPPAPPIWTLNASGMTGGSHGAKLAGCHIGQAAGVYTFYDPSWDTLGTFSGSPLSCSFNYNGINGWNVTLATAVSGGNANGGWTTPKTEKERPTEVPAQSGDYTAQTGGGAVPEEDEKAASSAGYGKS
jgi:hypothetical protein